MIKIYIAFEFQGGAAGGGGNQFLKALREGIRDKGCLAERPDDADVILFNSYQYLDEVLSLKRSFPQTCFVHRVDGPMRLYNHLSDCRDQICYLGNSVLADGTIFQSQWSYEKNIEWGMKGELVFRVIINAPNPDIFFPDARRRMRDPVRVILVSWSKNPNKGFDEYAWLDQNLDFEQYALSFVGNSPISFTNIKNIGPLSAPELASQLRAHDIFLTASHNDPCSNALLEALHSGLPSIVRNEGGHPELVKRGGECFDSIEEVPALLKKVTHQYDEYLRRIDLPSLVEVTEQYVDFCDHLYREINSGIREIKQVNLLTFHKVYLWLKFCHLSSSCLSYAKQIKEVFRG